MSETGVTLKLVCDWLDQQAILDNQKKAELIIIYSLLITGD